MDHEGEDTVHEQSQKCLKGKLYSQQLNIKENIKENFVYAVYAFAFAWSEHSLNRKLTSGSCPFIRSDIFYG